MGLALLTRLGLGTFGTYYYLPLLPAVVIAAVMTSRGATALAVLLSVAANVMLVPTESMADAALNALFFAAVGVVTGEVARARRKAKAYASELKDHLTVRDATIEAMLASTPLATIDPTARIRAISAPACALFQVREADVVGRPLQCLVADFDAELLRSSTDAASAPEQGWSGRRLDGGTFPVAIHMAFVASADASPDAVLTFTDLSLWHGAEARSQDLADQLNQVWRMNSLGEIAATLSHELNQPLTAATTYLFAARADLDRTGSSPKAASSTLGLAQDQMLRAGEIIRHARELLAVDQRGLQPERASSMIDDLAPIIRLLGPEAGTQIRIAVDENGDEVMADRIQFQQAIVNLARNAVEAVGDRPRREVAIVGRAVSPTAYRFSVEDSGPGVAPDQIDSLFQPLMTTKANGMGLGLSVTRTIVESHGGALEVQRSDLGGAAFAFSLQRCPG